MGLDYKVYERPRGNKRYMMAKFALQRDAVNWAHDRAKTLRHTAVTYMTLTVHDGRLLHTVKVTPNHLIGKGAL